MQNLPLLDFGRPYYITPHAARFYIGVYQKVLQAKAEGRDIRQIDNSEGGEGVMPKAVEGRRGEHLPRGEDSYGYERSYDWTFREGVATIDFAGPVVKRSTYLSSMSGMASTASLSVQIGEAIEHLDVSSVIICFDSPGGESGGLPEVAARIRDLSLSSGKSIVGYVDNMCASAAYFLASACSEIVVAPNALVGSIGSVYAFYDDKEALAMEGLKEIVIRNVQSPKKYLDPASDEGQQEMQRLATESAQIFGEAVAKYRDVDIETVWKDFGQGSVLTGQSAVDVGMVDRLGDYETLVSQLSAENSVSVENNSDGAGLFSMPSQGANMATPQLNEEQAKHGFLSWLGLSPAQAATPVEIAPNATAQLQMPNNASLQAEIESLKAQLADKETNAAKSAARDLKLASLEATIKSKFPPAAQESWLNMAKNSLDNDAALAHMEAVLKDTPASTWTEQPKLADGGGVFVNPEEKSGNSSQKEQADKAGKAIVNGKDGETVDRSLYSALPIGVG